MTQAYDYDVSDSLEEFIKNQFEDEKDIRIVPVLAKEYRRETRPTKGRRPKQQTEICPKYGLDFLLEETEKISASSIRSSFLAKNMLNIKKKIEKKLKMRKRKLK